MDRVPWRYVVPFGSNRKNRRADIRERNRLTINLVATLGEVIVEEQSAQVFRMHAVGQARGIGIPSH